MPQNGPKTARFGPFRAVRGRKILPSIDIFIPTVFPASCCGALRSKTPIKMGISGYFWVFLGISFVALFHGLKGCFGRPLAPSGLFSPEDEVARPQRQHQ